MRVRRDFNRTGESQQIALLKLSPDLKSYNEIQKKFHRFLGGPKVKIPVIWLSYDLPPNLKLNRRKLFYFEIGGKRFHSELKDFEMDPKGNVIPIGIDLSQIEDVNESLDEFRVSKDFSLKYKLFWRNGSGEIEHIDQGELELEIVPLHCLGCKLKRTKILAKTDNEESISVEHKINKSQERIWEFVFIHPGNLSFSNPVESKLVLRVEEDGKSIENGFFLEGEYGEGTEYNLHKLAKNKEASIFITIDYRKFENPVSPRMLEIFVDEIHSGITGNNEKNTIFNGRLSIHPDRSITQLCMEVRHIDENLIKDIRQEPSQVIRIENPITWAIGIDHNIELLAIELCNNAHNPQPHGQIDIKNFQLDLLLEDEKGKMISRKGWLKEYSEPPGDFNIPNGGNLFQMEMVLASVNIHKAVTDEINGYVSIKFHYRETQPKKNWDSGEKEVELKIEFVLKRYVEKWVALDFGTSAIATAIFDPELQKQNSLELLNLNEIHHQLLLDERGKKGDIKFDEMGTEFLSSLMYLDIENSNQEKHNNPIASLSPNIIRFSPHAEIKKNINFLSRVLPNIKILMGHDNVPLNYSSNMRAFKIDSKTYEKLPVNIILVAAYQQLFKNYIIPSIIKLYSSYKGQLLSLELLKTFGNIVITVPNTFNQTHLQILRELILKHIKWDLIPEHYKSPEIKNRNTSLFFKDRIKFVSESDAVACYYLKRWGQFNPEKEENPPIEYLLIYDIGAGTVDVSYLRVTQGEGELKIEDLGKIGAINAGNCLDTVLTQIVDLQAKLTEVELNYEVFSGELKNLANLVYLKEFVRNGIKIELSRIWESQDGNASLKFNVEALRQTRAWDEEAFKEIAKLKLFKKNYLLDGFLDSITMKLIKNLSSITDEGHLKNSVLQVDKVIISGRMANFKPLQDSLRSVLMKYTAIDSEKNIIIVPEDDLKKAVVLGALDRVTTYSNSDVKSRDINAYYGLLWKKKAFGGKDFSFKVLLKPGFKPRKYPEGPVKYDTARGLYILDAGKINMNFADKVSLVKSFTPFPNESYSSARSEMISKILEIRKNAFSTENKKLSKVPVKLKYDDNLMLRLKVKNVETNPANIKAYSLEQNLTYEENSWPFNQMIYLSKEQNRILEKIKAGEILWEIGTDEDEKREELEEQEEKVYYEDPKINKSEKNNNGEEDDELLL